MNGEQLGRALQDHKGFSAVRSLDLAVAESLDVDRYDFVGVRIYLGSVVSCGVLTIQGEDLDLVRERVAEFYEFSRSMKPYAGSVYGARMGAFGMLVVLAHSSPSPEFERAIRRLRLGSGWRKDYCVTWLIDVPGRAVIPHRGVPFGMFPGRRFFARLLAGEV